MKILARRLGVGLLSAVLMAASPGFAQQGRPLVYGGDADFPPYEYLDENGTPAGFNVALIQFAALRANIPVVIRLAPWKDVLPQLDRGEIDLVSLAYSEERARRYAFLDQTWTLQQAVLFRPGRPSYPPALNQLQNETVAVEERSLVHDLLATLPEVQRPVLKTFASQPEAVAAFLDGQSSAVAGNELSLRFAAARLSDEQLAPIRVKSLAYHLATRRGNESAVAPLAAGYRRLASDGTLHRLVEEHLTVAGTPWTTFMRLLGPVAGIALVGAVLAIAWSRTLRHRVRDRTLELVRQKRAFEQQSQLLDLAHDAIIVTDLEGHVTFWNRGAEEMYGWSRHEALRRDLTELLRTELPEPRDAILERLASQGRWEGELKQVRREGRTIWVKSRWALQRGPDGGREAILEINSEITEERRQREQLRAAEERFRAVANNLLGGLIVVDDRGIIEIMNPAAERITGWTAGELVGQPLAQLLPPDVGDLSAFYAAARSKGLGKRTQWTLRRKDGTLVPFELSLFEFHTGGKYYLGGSMREIRGA
jgi:PAS domain S-box-containing protein